MSQFFKPHCLCLSVQTWRFLCKVSLCAYLDIRFLESYALYLLLENTPFLFSCWILLKHDGFPKVLVPKQSNWSGIQLPVQSSLFCWKTCTSSWAISSTPSFQHITSWGKYVLISVITANSKPDVTFLAFILRDDVGSQEFSLVVDSFDLQQYDKSILPKVSTL